MDRGLASKRAVASVPSETYPNLASSQRAFSPATTGFPRTSGSTGGSGPRGAHEHPRLFPSTDYLAPEARTLFERLPSDTVAVTAPLARGVTVHARNRIALIASYARNDWSFLDRKTLDDVGDAYVGAADRGARAAARLGALRRHGRGRARERAGEQGVPRRDGRDRPRVRPPLRRLSNRRHLDERILFVLVSDHGNRSYATFVDANELVNRA